MGCLRRASPLPAAGSAPRCRRRPRRPEPRAPKAGADGAEFCAPTACVPVSAWTHLGAVEALLLFQHALEVHAWERPTTQISNGVYAAEIVRDLMHLDWMTNLTLEVCWLLQKACFASTYLLRSTPVICGCLDAESWQPFGFVFLKGLHYIRLSGLTGACIGNPFEPQWSVAMLGQGPKSSQKVQLLRTLGSLWTNPRAAAWTAWPVGLLSKASKRRNPPAPR